MSVQVVNDTIFGGTPVRAGPQQAAVEAEITLPGGLRDEVRILYADASVVPQQCEAAGGRATVSGKVDFHVLYAQGDLTRVKAAEVSRDFSRALTVNGYQDSAGYTPSCEINGVTARVFNGRVLLQADMNVYAEAFKKLEQQKKEGNE